MLDTHQYELRGFGHLGRPQKLADADIFLPASQQVAAKSHVHVRSMRPAN